MKSTFSPSKAPYLWAAAGWTLAIVAACTIPPPSVQAVEPILGFDKAIHAGLFLIFGGLWMRAVCPPGGKASFAELRRRGGMLFLIGLLFSGGLEVYQQYLPFDRVADPYDAIANGVGLVGGIIVYVIYATVRSD